MQYPTLYDRLRFFVSADNVADLMRVKSVLRPGAQHFNI